jgi:hypothetical protein
MKGSHQMLFFASFLVFFESAKALETECDVCHVNYYHKVCASSSYLSENARVMVFVVFDADDDDDDDDFPVVGGRLVDFLSRVVFVNSPFE